MSLKRYLPYCSFLKTQIFCHDGYLKGNPPQGATCFFGEDFFIVDQLLDIFKLKGLVAGGKIQPLDKKYLQSCCFLVAKFQVVKQVRDR